MRVVKIVEEDIADKIDTLYILNLFRHIENVGITFVCTKDGQSEDDWVDEDGRHIVIQLPYSEVKQMSDIKPLMLTCVKERLGLVA
jgi:hypothetical protein